MDAALNLYDQFEPRTDCYFFRMGSHGQVCFHGRNYNIKKRMSAEQTAQLIQDQIFIRIASDCYVNVSKISELTDDAVYFGEGPALNYRLALPKRKQQPIRQLMSERHGHDVKITV